MSIEFDAIYENGVIRPTTSALAEHGRVRVIVQHGGDIARRSYGVIGWTVDPKVVEGIANAPVPPYPII